MVSVEHKLIDMLEAGALSYNKVALACLAFMSEDDIRTMARNEELYLEEYDQEEVYFEVSIELEGGGQRFLQRFEVEEDDVESDVETAADEYAEAYCDGNNVTTIVERVTDNGGNREEVTKFDPDRFDHNVFNSDC